MTSLPLDTRAYAATRFSFGCLGGNFTFCTTLSTKDPPLYQFGVLYIRSFQTV